MQTYKGKPIISFDVMDQDFVDFMALLDDYGFDVNHLPKFSINSEYIEVSIHKMSHMVEALDDWLGNHKRLQVSYMHEKEGMSEVIHHPRSPNEIEAILQDALTIDILGTFH